MPKTKVKNYTDANVFDPDGKPISLVKGLTIYFSDKDPEVILKRMVENGGNLREVIKKYSLTNMSNRGGKWEISLGN